MDASVGGLTQISLPTSDCRNTPPFALPSRPAPHPRHFVCEKRLVTPFHFDRSQRGHVQA